MSASFTTGVNKSTALGDIVLVPVPLMGPYGMLLGSGKSKAVFLILSSNFFRREVPSI